MGYGKTKLYGKMGNVWSVNDILYHSTQMIWKILCIYLVLCLMISLFMRIIHKRKGKVAGKFILNIKFSLVFLLLLFIMGHELHFIFQRDTNWDPKVSKEDIVGRWEKGDHVLIFQENGRVEIINHPKEPLGTKYSWNLTGSYPAIKFEDKTSTLYEWTQSPE